MTPIDRILTENGIKNHDLVEIFPGRLSHKTVQKARLGTRSLSRNMQILVTEALNAVLKPEKPYKRKNLFSTEHAQISDTNQKLSVSEQLFAK